MENSNYRCKIWVNFEDKKVDFLCKQTIFYLSHSAPLQWGTIRIHLLAPDGETFTRSKVLKCASKSYRVENKLSLQKRGLVLKSRTLSPRKAKTAIKRPEKYTHLRFGKRSQLQRPLWNFEIDTHGLLRSCSTNEVLVCRWISVCVRPVQSPKYLRLHRSEVFAQQPFRATALWSINRYKPSTK